MQSIITLPVTSAALSFDGEPSDAELDAIETEMPLVLADVELLDAVIKTLDRPVSKLDERRIRRARNRVVAARRGLTNRVTAVQSGGAA
ncbi:MULTISPECIES: DUF6284 family protein [Streptomyces]|uniref:Uncharacterized protein n=1 Tax=Streptomyces venezuelae (strain ATCC 10712 / CBS 650.69 / DSM 40230 / JCM 4526 / NBRC 13096 / PD 04745) TaxID=953739 RepID=F2R3C9_STRVP|nr:DUF6284 family protein [Streptomyces venezuelae]APE21704.1 hypothetical protein vnz_12180 [Streptomyces venezuelae]QER99086.1 hypothetical protein DEJ43_12320 [Streptomyces venezuelae ATCC 10712]CCA55771.1 hypothetical protein SVEN_2485 [Streptomyces venezuelae ATCC 10712]